MHNRRFFLPANPKKEAAQRHPRQIIRAEGSFLDLGAIGVVFQLGPFAFLLVPVMVRCWEEPSIAAFDLSCDEQANAPATHVDHTRPGKV